MIRVAIVCPDSIVRAGLRALVESCADFCVAAEAEAHRPLHMVKRVRPNVILACTPSTGESILLLKRLHQGGKAAAVLMLTDRLKKKEARRLFLHGASGLLLKDSAGDHLHWAIPALTQGAHVLSPEFSESLIHEYVGPPRMQCTIPSSPLHDSGLSRREREVLTLVGDGLSNKDIGEALGIRPDTVKDHLSSLYAKLRVKNRMQAARMAWQWEDLSSRLTGTRMA